MVSALVHGLNGLGSSPWPGTLCCVLGQDTLLSQCLSPPRCINGYRRFVGGNLTNCWGVTCDGLASRPGGVEILLAASCYGNWDKLRPDGASWLYKAHFPVITTNLN